MCNYIAYRQLSLEESLDVKFMGAKSIIKLSLGGQKIFQNSINDG
jgi:hypothetical protein